MLNRCSPRSSTAAVSGNGSASASATPFFPVKNAASSWSVPRATVPSTSGRALEPFLKKMLSRSGIDFGELCMSCRQADTASSPAASSRRVLWLDFIDLARIEPLQEVQRALAIELRILRFDQQEELVAARVLEPLDVERRVVRHRQAVQDDHADDRRDRGEEDRELEGDRNELRPAVQRLAGDVRRERDEVHPLLQADAGQQSHDAA